MRPSRKNDHFLTDLIYPYQTKKMIVIDNTMYLLMFELKKSQPLPIIGQGLGPGS